MTVLIPRHLLCPVHMPKCLQAFTNVVLALLDASDRVVLFK